MSKDNKSNIKKEGYTIIYYEVATNLNINYFQYLILNEMFRKSKRFEYRKGIVEITKKFVTTRNTVINAIEVLYKKGLIEGKEETNYYLNIDIADLIIPKVNSKGLKIYHSHRRRLKLSIIDYSILYLFYSFSRKRKLKEIYSGFAQYESYLDKGYRTFYRAKNRLKDLKLIREVRKNAISLNDECYNWFEVQHNINYDSI